MDVQSLLFSRDSWTVSKAKAWAKSHGYRYGKVDVTDQYIRIRQFDPKGSKVKRTITFGRGIRAVVAREDSMLSSTRSTREAPRRHRRRTAKKAAKRPRRRRAKKVAAVQARRTHRRRRRARVAARRRRPVGHMMEAKRSTRRRRRRPSRRVKAWRGNPAGHARAAKKGWRRRRRSSGRRRARETAYEAPRRRRRRRTREAVAEAPRRRRRYHRRHHRGMFEAKRGGGMDAGHLALTVLGGGLGFVLADGLDRFLATYNPSSTDPKPTDKFTSDGAGTLANTLNVAAMPNWQRLAAGAGVLAVPAIGAAYIDQPMVKCTLQGVAFGAGIKLFSTLWNNVLMPMLVGKDTSTPALQKSTIARLYPAEVAARINMTQTPPQTAVSSTGSGALSGAADVGPFALSGESPYPDAAQALRRETGIHGSAAGNALPTVQNTWGTGASAAGGILPTVQQAMGAGGSAAGGTLPTAAQAMRRDYAGMSAPAGHGNPGQPGLSADWQPGPPPGPGPGPQAEPHTDPACGCIGENNPFLGFIGDAEEKDTLYATR